MKVLFAVWELDPLIKVGGLGDVARSLPFALSRLGVDIRVIIPFYKAVNLGPEKAVKIRTFELEYDGKKEEIDIYEISHPQNKFPVYLLKNKYFKVADFPPTFALFDMAVVEIIKKDYLSFVPDIIHCNDLHSGLIPLLVKSGKMPQKTILMIHNLAYQGKTSLDILDKMGIKKDKFRISEWEVINRQVSFLLEGIIHSDIVTTVSPTYAREIMTEEFGCGLEEILRGKEARVFGILNGIDNDWKNMMLNTCVKYPYKRDEEQPESNTQVRLYDWQEGKRLNKLFLQKKLGLSVDDKLPLLSFIGRFDPQQKGIDIIHKMMRRIDLEKFTFAILGTGDPSWEERFQWLDKFYPQNVAVVNKFDDCLAHQIYAASDFILIPSKFEPCGLIQMNAMFYGTIPIAHKTGGLKDSVKDGVNGFLFEKYGSEELEKTVQKAVEIYQKKPDIYEKMVKSAFKTDFSWKKSAGEYLGLYKKLIAGSI